MSKEKRMRELCREFIRFQQVSAVSTMCTIFMLLKACVCVRVRVRIQNIEI